MANSDTKTEHYLDVAANGSRADLPTETCCETRSQTLIRGVAERIMNLEDEVHEWKDNPDVADIVATYADLQNYDTRTLTDKDIIRVLQDEQYNGESTYYRWDKTDNEFDFIGTAGSYYTEDEVDQLLSGKQNTLTAGSNIDITNDVISATDTTYTAGTNVSISNENVISATDTTYADFVGTNGQTAGAAGLVPAPTAADEGKVLGANGTWVNRVDPSSLVISGAGAPTTATTGTVGLLYENTTNGSLYQCTAIVPGTDPDPDTYTWREVANVEQLSWRQRKPVVVWEVDGTVVTTGLVAVGEDISANPNWQLTDLDLTPYKRIKIFTRCAQKAGTTASASTTPAMVLEMSLDPRAAIAEYGSNYVGSMVAQKPNDANRLCTLTCAVSADKTKFEVLRMTNLYGTAATANSDVGAYVFKIEGYYD